MRALVLSGGGAMGAYEVGALRALSEAGITHWDIVCGVSVGSINGTAVALWGNDDEGSRQLIQLWKSIGNKDVYKKHAPWIFNYIASFWKQSLYTMKPLEKFVLDRVGDPKLSDLDEKKRPRFKADIRVGIVHLQTGQYYAPSLKGKTAEEVAKLVHASSVFPGLFQPVELTGIPGVPHGEYVDGGIRDTVPLRSALADPRVTEVDVIITSPEHGHVKYQHEFKSAVDVGLRAAFIMSDEVMLTDRIQGMCAHRNVKLNLYAPSAPLRFDGFQFNQDAIGEMIGQGYDETSRALAIK